MNSDMFNFCTWASHNGEYKHISLLLYSVCSVVKINQNFGLTYLLLNVGEFSPDYANLHASTQN
jgi:hypothetical protein